MGCSPEARLRGATAGRANWYLCLNWAPGRAAVRKARFWCQQEVGRASGGRERPLGTAPWPLCVRLSLGHHLLPGTQLLNLLRPLPKGKNLPLTLFAPAYLLIHSLSPISTGLLHQS